MSEPRIHASFLRHFLGHRDSLYAFILAMVRDPTLTEDIFQDVSVVLWEKFSAFEEGSSFGAWARQIAFNKIRNDRRLKGRTLLATSSEAVAAVDRAFSRVDERASEEDWRNALQRCLGRLTASARRLVELRYYEGFGLEEIAIQLGRTVGGVHAGLCKVRLALETCLRQYLTKRG